MGPIQCRKYDWQIEFVNNRQICVQANVPSYKIIYDTHNQNYIN